MTRPLTARQRAEVLAGDVLVAAGAPDARQLAAEVLAHLAREGILVVDEPIRAPIGSRRYRSRPQAAP